MSEIRFGAEFENPDFESTITLSKQFEKLGFDFAWIIDHLGGIHDLSFPHRYECFSTLGAVARETEKIKLAVICVDMGRRNPCTLAQEITTVDLCSKGRLVVGIGVGGNVESYGRPQIAPVDRMVEQVKIMEEFWAKDVVNYAGKFYNFQNASMMLKPIQKPHPPMWFDGKGPRLLRIVGEMGSGWITGSVSPSMIEQNWIEVKKSAARANRDITDFPIAYSGTLEIAHEHEEAFNNISEFAKRVMVTYSKGGFKIHEKFGYKKPWLRLEDVPDNAVQECFIFGTPDDCISRIEKYRKAGVTHFMHYINNRSDKLEKRIKDHTLFKKVIEYFHDGKLNN